MTETLQRATLLTTLESSGNSANVLSVITAMQAMHCLIEEAHAAIDIAQELHIRAKPFQPGSFGIPIEIAATAVALWQGQGLLDWILMIAKQYLSLKKLLGGEKYAISGDNNIVLGDGSTLNVYPPTAELMRPDNEANRLFQSASRQISSDRGVNGLRIEHAESQESLIELARNELKSLTIPKGITDETPSRTHVKERVRLRIRSAAFDDRLRWRFICDGSLISAKLSDENFMKRVLSGERFAGGDTLVADVLVTQRWDRIGNGFVDDDHEIMFVHRHIPRDARSGQLSLLGEDV